MDQFIKIAFGINKNQMTEPYEWVHKAESGRPNHRKPEGQILVTIRPNRKAEFDRKAENISSLISA